MKLPGPLWLLSTILKWILSIAGWALWTTTAVVIAVAILYLLVLTLYLSSTQFKVETLLGNRLSTPFYANFSNPEQYGLQKAKNLNISGSEGNLGAWFVSPPSEQYISKTAYILYLHGQAGSRAIKHRIELYQRLSKLGYHILAVDYRGYADSDGWPDEAGMVDDGQVAYKWLLQEAGGHPVYIWGHSLGAAVAVQVAAKLEADSISLNGLFMESPFNNLTDLVLLHPVAAPIQYIIPNLGHFLSDVENLFKSDFWIQKVLTPTLILHDESDDIIVRECAVKLEAASKLVASSNVRRIEFYENLKHNHIARSERLPAILRDFILNTS